MFCSANFYFLHKPKGSIIQKGINLSAHAFQADAALLKLLWLWLCLSCPPKYSWSPGLPAGREGPAQGTCLCPLASATLTLKEGVSGVWDIHNTSKYNATTLLRHQSVVFKHFSSFKKYIFYLFLFGCTESLLCHVGSSSLTWDWTRASLLYISSCFYFGAKLQHKVNSSC